MSEHPTTVISRDAVARAEGPASAGDATAATPEPEAPRPSRRSLAVSRLTSNASAGVWGGLVVAALGFGLIFFSWVKVAATLDVGRQMPYVVSGAMTGLGMIVVGIAVVDMAVRRQDRIERRHQLSLMRTLLEELREVVEPAGTSGSTGRRDGS